jgi:tetratricopeptide (TPR) repeat protein
MLEEDDLQNAGQFYQRSLTMRTELGEKGGMAQSQLSLANLALENDRADQAESLARDAASEFEKENDSDQRTAAEDVLARSLIAQGKYDQAAREIAVAEKLGARDLPTTLSLSITSATLLGKTGKATEAERELQTVEARAAGKGLLVLEWQARLALAEVQTLIGQQSSARSNLEVVKQQSTAKGFRLFARKAADAEASPRHRG